LNDAINQSSEQLLKGAGPQTRNHGARRFRQRIDNVIEGTADLDSP